MCMSAETTCFCVPASESVDLSNQDSMQIVAFCYAEGDDRQRQMIEASAREITATGRFRLRLRALHREELKRHQRV